jgi:hypothetical protein
MRKIKFQYKGQMVNYYNKIKDNEKIKRIYCGLDANGEYFLEYTY